VGPVLVALEVEVLAALVLIVGKVVLAEAVLAVLG